MIANADDLAGVVHSRLLNNDVETPSLRSLRALMDIAFSASLRTEELAPVRTVLVIQNPQRPDPSPPLRVRVNRWVSIQLKDRIRLNTHSLSKMAQTAGPDAGCLSVYWDTEGWFIWGMVDQGRLHQYSVHLDAAAYPIEAPLIRVDGPGRLSVSYVHSRIAELVGGRLVTSWPNVFEFGPVRSGLNNCPNALVAKGRVALEEHRLSLRGKALRTHIQGVWSTAVRRILLAIQSNGHGGAIAISSPSGDLNSKYRVSYSRIMESSARVAASGQKLFRNREKQESYFEQGAEPTAELMAEGEHWEALRSDAQDELDGSIAYVSKLSSVDGALWFDLGGTLRGFGVELKSTTEPTKILQASIAVPDPASLEPLSAEGFGTRHRSMMRFCWASSRRLGFVCSQDGSVKAVRRLGENLIVWDNVLLERSEDMESEVKELREIHEFSLAVRRGDPLPTPS